ncbi:DUF1266 domain-containing protein [Maribacter sp.]|uniref:DUF1266 domain-containing protein n=1 Tax=Maribacter sp. TaxID=1897614 RepID=UPI0025C670D8|nr:DUF1266 domain-containing protein [Maribacter sp.]
MQMFENLPWYGYVILIIGIASYAIRYFKKAKESYDEPDLENVKFRKDVNGNLNETQLFSLSLDAVTNEWWKVNTNTLFFKKGTHADNYIEGWGIDTAEGYWGLTNYFMEDGRRWYFDFIYNMLKTEPEANWDNLMNQKFGKNERAERYLNSLKSGKAIGTLKSKGFITFDSELDKGVAAYDSSVLVGHARRAYTAELISEQQAWEVINFATQLAKDNFSSWDEFGKSYILGFTLDIRDRKDGFLEEMYHMYKQIQENPQSPWNTINW